MKLFCNLGCWKNDIMLGVPQSSVNPKGTGGWGEACFPPPLGFLLITPEVEIFSTRNFVTFPNIKCKIRAKLKRNRNLHLGSRDMTIFGEWA